MVQIREEQFGFMPGRSTTEAIFAMRQLIEQYRGGQQNLHCVFIDLEKAYDCVPREETRVWNCLRLKSVPETHIQLIQYLKGCREPFAVTVGVHQGSVLSQFLLAILMDYGTENIRRSPWEMMFADDVLLCSSTREERNFKTG